MSRPTFILIGASGYVAPRHMAAIKAVDGDLIAAVDPHDSVGVLDRYFPKCQFFRDHLDAFEKVKADYAVICTPNNTHGVMAWHAMEAGMNVILEKPATITAGRIDELQEIEKATGKRVFCILQMRLHPEAESMKHQQSKDTWRVVGIDYHTPRGPWYFESWKANKAKSGGILFNIGIHLFDLAISTFGLPLSSTYDKFINEVSDHDAIGSLELEHAAVSFDLSINGHKRERIFYVDGEPYDFTNGFDDLHLQSYINILSGKGFTLEDARPAIELCERLTNAAQT